jgi:hypothetical protein
MAHHPGVLERRSNLFARSLLWELAVQATDNDDLMAATSQNGVAVGAAVAGFAAVFLRNPQSFFWTTATATGDITVRFVGEDVHGNTIQEDIVMVGNTTGHSALCYRKLTTAIVLANTSAAGHTLALGYSATAGVAIPLLAKGLPAGSVLSVQHVTNAIVNPTATVDSTESNIALTGTVTAGTHRVYLDRAAAAYL